MIRARHIALRHSVLLAAVLALGIVVAPGVSHARGKTLARSMQNLILFPFDLALSPYVGGKAVFLAWKDSDDTKAVKYGYAPFAPIWGISVQAGASIIRGVAGALELLPGLVLLPFDAEMDPLYDLPETQPALVDQEAGPVRFKFGIDYLAPSE
ncbi:MAG: hypothetical protein MUF70_11430 [Myxococcota bacterium]|nr:hypothetical protein [Myxococcota bacterium]